MEGSHDKESSINTPEGGFIHNTVCRSDDVLVAVLRCSPRVFRCLVDRLCFRQGRIRHKLVSGKEARDRTLILQLTGDLSLPVSGSPTAYLAVGKRAPGVADPAMTIWCRWFVFVSRATLMSARDARHTPPPLSVVLVPVETKGNSKGEIGGGWGVTPDRPANADQIRESPSALALEAPALWRTTKQKSWSARNHRVTLALVSLALAIHWRGAWSVRSVNLRPRRW